MRAVPGQLQIRPLRVVPFEEHDPIVLHPEKRHLLATLMPVQARLGFDPKPVLHCPQPPHVQTAVGKNLDGNRTEELENLLRPAEAAARGDIAADIGPGAICRTVG